MMPCSDFFVYILLCENNAFYTGITNDLEKRIKTHIKGRGAYYTKVHTPTKLLVAWRVPSKSVAMSIEYFIKSKTKKIKLEFIEKKLILKNEYIKEKAIKKSDISIKAVQASFIDKLNKTIDTL